MFPDFEFQTSLLFYFSWCMVNYSAADEYLLVSHWWNLVVDNIFLRPRVECSGAYCFHPVFCLSVCLSVVNFNLVYNFWIVRDRNFIFGMHTPLMMPFYDTKVNYLGFGLCAKITFLDFVAPWGIVFHKHMYFFFSKDVNSWLKWMSI